MGLLGSNSGGLIGGSGESDSGSVASHGYSGFFHDDGEPMQDLYLIDTLLHLMVDHQNGSWPELESRYNGTAKAMDRLRRAFESGEITRIGYGLAEHFRKTGSSRPE